MKKIKICFQFVRYAIDSIKSIFIDPKTGFSTNDDRAKQQLELLNNLFDLKRQNILIVGEGNNTYMSRQLSSSNLIQSIDKYHKHVSHDTYLKYIREDILKHNFVQYYIFDGRQNEIKFDYIFSFYTLEHINKIDETLIKLHDLLKIGGKCFHVIGLGNHGMFNDVSKNYYKTIPDFIWKSIGFNKINRKSREYYMDHFEKYYSDYEVVISDIIALGIIGVK